MNKKELLREKLESDILMEAKVESDKRLNKIIAVAQRLRW